MPKKAMPKTKKVKSYQVIFQKLAEIKNYKKEILSFSLGAIVMLGLCVSCCPKSNKEKLENRVRILENQVFLLQQRNKMPPPPFKPKKKSRKVAFNESEYKPYAQKGDLSLSGNACNMLPDNLECPKKVYVFLNPVTSYSNEWYKEHWAGNKLIENPDKRAWTYHKKAVVQENGDFVFSNLPQGEYYIGAELCAKQIDMPNEKCHPLRLGDKITVNASLQDVSIPVVHKENPTSKRPCGCQK